MEGWGDSSVGRVLALQAQGPGFNPQHQKKKKKNNNNNNNNKEIFSFISISI